MDENGDAEGNYTLIARKALRHNKEQFGLFPVGIFARTASRLPVSQLLESCSTALKCFHIVFTNFNFHKFICLALKLFSDIGKPSRGIYC